jgi:hypothetical protein
MQLVAQGPSATAAINEFWRGSASLESAYVDGLERTMAAFAKARGWLLLALLHPLYEPIDRAPGDSEEVPDGDLNNSAADDLQRGSRCVSVGVGGVQVGRRVRWRSILGADLFRADGLVVDAAELSAACPGGQLWPAYVGPSEGSLDAAQLDTIVTALSWRDQGILSYFDAIRTLGPPLLFESRGDELLGVCDKQSGRSPAAWCSCTQEWMVVTPYDGSVSLFVGSRAAASMIVDSHDLESVVVASA